jgi:hypothetical protein
MRGEMCAFWWCIIFVQYDKKKAEAMTKFDVAFCFMC